MPNVSLTIDNNTVHYNPLPIIDGHEYVKIGGIKWATMNVGANSITDTGLYFQWGDKYGYSAGENYFEWQTYKYCGDGYGAYMTKYNATDGKTVLDASDDAVTVAWGNSWRMPTTEEFQSLGNAVDAAWTTDYQGTGVAGLVCTDKTDSSKVLFFPACGYHDYDSVNLEDSDGYYWSSSINSSDVSSSYIFNFYGDGVNWQDINPRYLGCTVRGVVG